MITDGETQLLTSC